MPNQKKRVFQAMDKCLYQVWW